MIEISITDWSNYIGRKDVKKHHWFKFPNDFHDLDSTYNLSHCSVNLFMMLLSSASKKMCPNIKINPSRFCDRLRIKLDALNECLQELIAGELIARIPDTYVQVTRPTDTRGKKQEARSKRQEHERVEDNSDTISKIIVYLNQKAGKDFKVSTKSTQSKIKTLLKDFTVDEIKSVIDTKCEQWLYDPKMTAYLRPETLFSNKFESYLQEAKQKPTGSALQDFFEKTTTLEERDGE